MSRIGETKTSNEGKRMIISEYFNTNNITVMFAEDNSTQKTTYSRFKNGMVKKAEPKLADPMVGKEFIDANGDIATVIDRNGDNTLVVGYANGEIISGITVSELKNATFSPEQSENTESAIAMGRVYKQGNIKAERKATLENALYLLNRYHRCIMIRPCGFGKTWIAMKIFRMPQYRRCLFLHPMNDDANAERLQRVKFGKKVDCKTYAWLRNLSDEKITALDYDIVFFDECHGVVSNEEGKKGAVVTYKAIVKLMNSHPKTHFLGATATPFRMDGIDVVDLVFHRHACYPYTDMDAFEDGILKKPNYFYCVKDVVQKVRNAVEKESKKTVSMTRDEIRSALKLSDDEVNELDARYMDEHLARVNEQVFGENKNYFRFIAFYLTNDDISKDRTKVESWFRKAYPGYEVNSIVVTSNTGKSLKDVDALPTKPSKPQYKGRIDVIFNCEMLCMGYHSELIDGLIIDRGTKSLSKYMQMIGRLLSCDNDNPVVIFDIADNIHTDFIYNVSNPIAKDEIQSEATFIRNSEDILTYEGVLVANPDAIDWDEVEKTKEKTRLVVEALAEMSGEDVKDYGDIFEDDDVLKSNFKPSEAAPFEPTVKIHVSDSAIKHQAHVPYMTKPTEPARESVPESVKVTLESAKEIIKEKKLSLIEAGELMQSMLDVKVSNAKPSTKRFTANVTPSVIKAAETMTKKESEECTKAIITTDEEDDNLISSSYLLMEDDFEEGSNEEVDFGYSDWTYYYNPDDGNMYSKNVKLLNKQVNFEEELKNILFKATAAVMDKVIDDWHKYPQCEENYTSYAEVDKKSVKYKFLDACAWKENTKAEPVLRYMIEGIA